MRKYELTYLVSDEVPESDLNKVTGKVTGFVTELQGKVIKEDIWGRRKLAYPIKKQDFATYVTLYLDLPADKAVEFERDLRHIEGVMRQLMIVKELGSEEITLSAADIAATGEIQSVVGGEKSFEAIEGETEESRSLMAKREEKEDETAEPEEIEEMREPAKEESEKVEIEKEVKVEKPAKVKEEKAKIKEETQGETPAVEANKEEETKEEVKPKKAPAKKEEKKTEKAAAKKTTDKLTSTKTTANKKVDDEVERLSKLNEELDDILKDEL